MLGIVFGRLASYLPVIFIGTIAFGSAVEDSPLPPWFIPSNTLIISILVIGNLLMFITNIIIARRMFSSFEQFKNILIWIATFFAILLLIDSGLLLYKNAPIADYRDTLVSSFSVLIGQIIGWYLAKHSKKSTAQRVEPLK